MALVVKLQNHTPNGEAKLRRTDLAGGEAELTVKGNKDTTLQVRLNQDEMIALGNGLLAIAKGLGKR